jgi:hypothetical protein
MITLKNRLDEVLSTLSEERLRQVLEFASQLTEEEERADWHELGRNALSRAYGPDEPEYTEADFKVRYKS